MSLPLRPLRATDPRILSGSPSPLARRRRSTLPVEVGRGKGRIQRLCADLMHPSKNESSRYARRRVRAASEGSGHRAAERGTNRARPGPRCVLVGRQPPARFLLSLEPALVVGARRRTRAGRLWRTSRGSGRASPRGGTCGRSSDNGDPRHRAQVSDCFSSSAMTHGACNGTRPYLLDEV